MLSLHPKVQEKLYEEIISAQKSSRDGPLSYETVMQLPYTDAVSSETMSIYPPAVRAARRSREKGTQVEDPIYAIHHDPKFFPEPEMFLPERFMPENRESIIPYTYLPFVRGFALECGSLCCE